MIEKATFKDAPVIAQMAVKMWKGHTVDELVKDFEDMIEQEESVIFIFSIENQAVGFAQCQLRHDYVEGTDSSPVGYLEGIFMEQEFRHKGYAKELLGKCEEWAKNKGCLQNNYKFPKEIREGRGYDDKGSQRKGFTGLAEALHAAA